MRTFMRRSRAKQQSGQAGLISLLVVMLIIGVLAGMIYPGMAGRDEYTASGQVKGPATPIDRAYDTGCVVYKDQVNQAAFMYQQDHNAPPPDLESLKPYGVDNEIINTPDCNFGLPKQASQTGADGSQPYDGYGSSGPGAQPASSSAYPAAQPAAPAAAPANAPKPGYAEVGGVKVPDSSGAEGDLSGQ